MRGVITYFTIVCLTLANGASTDEESEAYIKNHHFDKGEVIHAVKPFWKDEAVYAVCEGDDIDKKCKVYVESINPGKKSIVRSCDLSLTYNGSSSGSVLLVNAGNSKAVFVQRHGDAEEAKLISVNLKSCEINEASIDVSPIPACFVGNCYAIVPHENKYDVLFPNKQICNDFFCKATFDYEGKLIKAASTFPIKYLVGQFFSCLLISYANNAYLVSESSMKSTNVHLVKDDVNQTKTTLFAAALTLPSFTGLSTEENKFGFCSSVNELIVCKQYDAEGKIKIETETSYILDVHNVPVFDMLNLEEGFLALSFVGIRSKNNVLISIVHFDEHGKENKSLTVDSKCDQMVLAKLYKNTSGQYCINFICTSFDLEDHNHRSRFSHSNRCFLKTTLF